MSNIEYIQEPDNQSSISRRDLLNSGAFMGGIFGLSQILSYLDGAEGTSEVLYPGEPETIELGGETYEAELTDSGDIVFGKENSSEQYSGPLETLEEGGIKYDGLEVYTCSVGVDEGYVELCVYDG